MTPWTAARQAPLSFTISWSLLKFVSIESLTLSSHLILCCPLILLPSIFPSIRVFYSESALHVSLAITCNQKYQTTSSYLMSQKSFIYFFDTCFYPASQKPLKFFSEFPHTAESQIFCSYCICFLSSGCSFPDI